MAGLIVCRHLADQKRGYDGILITCICAFQIAIAFLKAKQERAVTGDLMVFDDLTDKFKTGQNVIEMHTVRRTDAGAKLAGYDRFYGVWFRGHFARIFKGGGDIFQKKGAHLVAGDALEFAVFILCHNTHAIRIGIGGNDQIASYFVRDNAA